MDNGDGEWSIDGGYEGLCVGTICGAVGNLIRKAIKNRYYIDSKAEVGEDGEQGGSVDS